MAESSVAMLLGVSEQAINEQTQSAMRKLRDRLRLLASASD